MAFFNSAVGVLQTLVVALGSACEKFIRRFTAMEQSILAEGRTLEEVSREELLASWDAQKRNGR